MRLAEAVRHDQVAHALSHRFLECPSESALRDLVPARDRAVEAHDHDRVERGLQDGGQTDGIDVTGKWHDAALAGPSSSRTTT